MVPACRDQTPGKARLHTNTKHAAAWLSTPRRSFRPTTRRPAAARNRISRLECSASLGDENARNLFDRAHAEIGLASLSVAFLFRPKIWCPDGFGRQKIR